MAPRVRISYSLWSDQPEVPPMESYQGWKGEISKGCSGRDSNPKTKLVVGLSVSIHNECIASDGEVMRAGTLSILKGSLMMFYRDRRDSPDVGF